MNFPRALARAAAFAGLYAVCALSLAHAAPGSLAPLEPQTRTLDNGLRVAVFPIHRLPLVQIELRVPAGQSAEPDGQGGVAYLTAQLLTRGTTSRDAAEYSADAAQLGGSVRANASRDYAAVAGAFLASDLNAAMELVSDAVLNPLFSDDETRSAQASARSLLDRMHRDPSVTAGEQIWAGAFGRHPYGREPIGTDSTLVTLTRERVREFYNDHYRPDQAVLVIAGDVSPDSAFTAAGEWFARWTGHTAKAPAPAAPPALPRVRIIDMPDLPYTVIRLGARLPGHGSPDELAITLAASEFAGGSFSRLGRAEVGQKLGATVDGNLLTLRDAGLFSFGAVVETDSAAVTVDFLRDEMRKFAKAPPTDQDMPAIRTAAQTGLLAPLETLGGVTSLWAADAFASLPPGATQRTLDRITAITPAELASATARWLDADRVAIVAVGPAAALKPTLSRFGEVEVVTLLRSEAAPAVDTIPPTPENTAKGRAVVDRAIQAHGGLEAMRAIQDSRADLNVTVISGHRETRGTITQVRKEPERMISITHFGTMDTRQILADGKAWSQTPQTRTLEPADSMTAAGLKASFASDFPHLMLALVQKGAVLTSRGTDRVEQHNVDVVDVRLADGQRRRYFFDTQTHRLVVMDILDPSGIAQQPLTRRLYGAYREISGLQWPCAEERRVNGTKAMAIEITSIQTNLGVSDREFEVQGTQAHPSEP
jgi:predicted Zn-dependent peptidase